MSPAELHHLEHSKAIDLKTASTAAAAANANRTGLIIGGSIGIFMVVCAFTYVCQDQLRRYLRKRRQAKEMKSYSLELQKTRREHSAAWDDDGEAEERSK